MLTYRPITHIGLQKTQMEQKNICCVFRALLEENIVQLRRFHERLYEQRIEEELFQLREQGLIGVGDCADLGGSGIYAYIKERKVEIERDSKQCKH